MLRIERCGLGLDYYREIGGRLAGIGAEEILDASRRYMKLDRAVIASAGTLERGSLIRMAIRTGIDLIEIRRLETLNPSIRKRFFARVYTKRERENYEIGRASCRERV